MKNMPIERKRWIILVACCVMCMLQGTNSSWSVYRAGMMANDYAYFSGMSVAPTLAQIQLGYTINCASPFLFILLAGKVKEKIGPRLTIMICGAFCFLGLFLCGTFVDTTTKLALVWGIVYSAGFCSVYGLVTSVPVTFFPERCGVIAGLLIALNTAGSMIFSPIISGFITSYGIRTTFKIMACIVGIGVILLAQVVESCPSGWYPAGFQLEEKPAAPEAPSVEDVPPSKMLRDPRYYMIVVIWFALLCATSLFLSQGTSMVAYYANLDVQQDLAKCAAAVSGFMFFSLCLRFLWGVISDKIGRLPSLMCMGTIGALCALGILFLPKGYFMILIVGGVLFGCAGAVGSIMVALNQDCFGRKYATQNYGLLMVAGVMASVVGSSIAAMVWDATGSFNGIVVFTAVIMAVAVALSAILRRMQKKRTPVKES